ncbi:MAG: biotin-dependent carboxyltransferase family protein [Actinomycetota bacterium]|nr:biotin-dependent carboxyltransferase family protein [Actinomycetota bacterium]
MADGTGGLEVVAPGMLSLVQDLGRPGFGSVGVGRSGAADLAAFRRGSAMVGNGVDAAAVEVLLGGLTLQAHADLLLAVTGATAAVTIDDEKVDTAQAFEVTPGVVVAIGMAERGLRCYLAVRGGIDVPLVLGSRSTDTLSGIGPAALVAGQLLPIGSANGFEPETDSPATALPDEVVVLEVIRGPRDDWFADPELLVSTSWQMSPHSDRVGLRLTGGTLPRSDRGRGELPSEGMVRGCLQVPPGGEPVLLMPDHPVTGGYPVIGVVTESSMDLAAQCRPGQRLRFRWADPPLAG